MVSAGWEELLKIIWDQDFPGGPVVKTPPSNAGCVGSIPGQGTKIPQHALGCDQKLKKKKKKRLSGIISTLREDCA